MFTHNSDGYAVTAYADYTAYLRYVGAYQGPDVDTIDAPEDYDSAAFSFDPYVV